MKLKLVFFLTLVVAFPMSNYGQYISSVTYPDTTVDVISDTTIARIQFANQITPEDIKSHLSILASDAYEGRETGEKGNEMAAQYIADHFKTLGLPAIGIENSYFQNVYFNKTQWQENQIKVAGNTYKHLWDYLAFATVNHDHANLNPKEVIFLGYGIDDPKYSDYKNVDVKNKVILIHKGESVNKDSISYITGTGEMSKWSETLQKKLEVAKAHDVKLVLVIENELKKFLNENRRFLVSSSLQLGDGNIDDLPYADHVYISSTIAKDIIGSKAKKVKKWRKKNIKKARTCAIDLPTDLEINMLKKQDILFGHNVMGFVEGSDLKEEVIVVSAHYDHLGKKGKDVFNGADDNGSGTSTVLDIAESLQLAKSAGHGPRRSVLFLLVTGEEKGLLGSQYYAENPVFALNNTVANVNVDMIGRTDENYVDNPEYVYVIGSDRLSTDLHKLNESINKDYSQLILDYKFNDEHDPNRYYFRSDHYNFAKKGIPAIFFFSGVHEDYHRPSDTVEKILFDKTAKIGRHIFQLIWDLANQDHRIVVDGEVK